MISARLRLVEARSTPEDDENAFTLLLDRLVGAPAHMGHLFDPVGLARRGQSRHRRHAWPRGPHRHALDWRPALRPSRHGGRLVRSIYLTIKGMTDLFQFRARFGRATVIAFPFPRDGLWALGFVMGHAPR